MEGQNEETDNPSEEAAISPCPVCMEATDSLVRLQCGHSVCSSCLFQLRRPVCPICREPVFSHVEFYETDDDEEAGLTATGFFRPLLRHERSFTPVLT